MTDLRKTALNDWHIEQGAKMVPFAGYSMPVQYPDGIVKEHQFTRSHAGLFDVSHMGQIQVVGENIAQTLETVFPTDLVSLPEGKQIYSLLMNEEAGVLDDLMICRREHDFLLVVNASCKDKDFDYLQSVLGGQLQFNMLDDRSLVALQGPKAAKVMRKLGAEIDGMVFMDAAWVDVAGIECWVSRSGYTGEDGFEISVPNDKVIQLVDALVASDDVVPVGLGARDTLRLEAGLCLYGHELDEHTTPVEASISWAISKSRRAEGERPLGFHGAEVISNQLAEGVDTKRIAYMAEGRAPIRDGVELYDENEQLAGVVSSGGFSPSLGKPVLMARVDSDFADKEVLFAKVRNKSLPVNKAKLPFVPNRYYRG